MSGIGNGDWFPSSMHKICTFLIVSASFAGLILFIVFLFFYIWEAMVMNGLIQNKP